ncbi:MAG TPA: thiamine pyrophosphate-binding protein, partial [Bacillota bacterium]
MARTFTVAEHTVAQLAAWGVEHVFGVAGDTIIPLLEALRQSDDVAFVAVRHEESAGFMASACAKLTGRPGVCLAEAGPAAVHLLSGVYDAHMDRVPVLALTGESATERLGTHWPQTIDQQLLYTDATCFNHTLATERQLPDLLYQALRTAETEADVSRLGLPVDLQLKPVQGPIRARPGYLNVSPMPDEQSLREAARLLGQAERPVVFVGQGARGQGEAVVRLADQLGAAIIHTLPAKGIVPADHPRNLGVIGDFGTEPAAEVFAQGDVVLVVGSTWWQPDYVPNARFIQIDRSLRHVDMLFPVDVGLVGTVADVVPRLIQQVRPRRNQEWERLVADLKASWDEKRRAGDAAVADPEPLARGDGGVPPQRVVAALQERLGRDAILCLDVGDNTFWISTLFAAGSGQQLLISGHWRSMGFGLPAAIAAKLILPGRPAVAVVGDGGFAMTMAEFTTAVDLGLPVTIIVLNNGVLAEEGHKQAQMRLEPFGVR